MTITINLRRLFALERWGKQLAQDQQDLRERNQARMDEARAKACRR